MSDLWYAVFSAFAALGLVALGFLWQRYIYVTNRDNALKNAEDILANAREKADLIVREADGKALEKMHQVRADFEEAMTQQRREMMTLTDRFIERETNLDRKTQALDRRELTFEHRVQDQDDREQTLAIQFDEVDALIREQRERLEEIAGLTADQARNELRAELQEEIQEESLGLMQSIQANARADAESRARKIIALAIERYAADTVSEITTCSIQLPSDEMKGRLIGKEGRNIRSIESVTGVNLLIDDTPETVVISTYDPLRREVARIAVERLVSDGRIHPARVEEVVAKVRSEMDENLIKTGEQAVRDLRLEPVAPEVIQILGRLKYRFSFSQNVLDHSLEMAAIMATLAAELRLDVQVAKRIGLFHDIGKALTHEVEGSHALIGASLLEKHGEDPVVVNAVAAHHGEAEPETLYAHLCVAADAITAARPGARTETTTFYLDRLEKLEGIANSFRGVTSSYAIHAGRELRVIVEPRKISDTQAADLARNISRKIKETMNYPGQIRVTVVRETRCIEYAR